VLGDTVSHIRCVSSFPCHDRLGKCTDLKMCMFSSFHSQVDENCVLLVYCVATRGISLPTFPGNLSVPSSRVKNPRKNLRRRQGSTTTRSVISQENAILRPQNTFPNVSLAFLSFFLPCVCKITSSSPVTTLSAWSSHVFLFVVIPSSSLYYRT